MTTGKHPEHTCFQITVTIAQDAEGRMWSEHEFTTPTDQQMSLTLPNGGVPQVAQALLTEAARREVYCGVLAKLSRDPEFLNRWTTGTDEERQRIEVELANASVLVMNRSAVRLALSTAVDILGMMARAPL